ncbi:endonuclease [Streptomyces botrytidirepellens]|uniref:Endonuclease n=2 Tax=Streptomyces botrytidirepellens TaxID=2486417 RepID=A0A3M8XCE7_9ACTN|nr:jacalin-like lectin [Streptomyces botrytidirepellens]RNG38455.1 endonuclease [Streptomyces botrytidirepellens]
MRFIGRRMAVAVAAALATCAGTLGATTPAVADAKAAPSGSFNVLTYNVAGLPEGLSSGHPEKNTPLISPRLGAYDIVNVQEDFNYHAALYAGDDHPYRTPTSGGAAFGDGLNTLSDLRYDDFERVKWRKCNGTDCLTPKGFSLARVRLAEGAYLDLYNVHTNAGTTDADLAARRANITQLSDFITANSAGNAVLVMGDTNTRYTRAADNIRDLATRNGLTDAWVNLVRGGSAPPAGSDALVCDPENVTNTCEVVDKVLYRSGPLLSLTATRYNNDNTDFLDAEGKPLSDHYPHTVDFSWKAADGLRAGDQFGGPHGTAFNDADDLPATPAPRTLTLRGGSRLDAVSLTLSGGTTLGHGGSGGTAASLTLGSGEHLTSATLSRGQKDGRTRLFSAAFTTDKGRTVSAGTPTSDTATFTAPDGWQIVGFTGRAGDEIDKLGVIYAPR